jgi:hypothetical protein
MAENSGNYFSLNDVLKEYSSVILDTNSFLGIGSVKSEKNITNKLLLYEIREVLFDFWNPILKENSKIYITNKVFNELSRDHYNYKDDLRNGKNSGRLYTKLRRIKKRLKNKRNILLDEFPRDRIISRDTLEDKSLYDSLYKKYFYFTNLCGGIGLTDLDLIIMGGVFSKIKNNSAVISNDSGIRNSWRRFLCSENLPRHKYLLYSQRGINLFKKEFANSD